MPFYIVLEVQNDGTTPATIPLVYTDLSQAYSKYYAVLSVAATSSLPYHSCFLIADSGVMLEWKIFDRRTGG